MKSCPRPPRHKMSLLGLLQNRYPEYTKDQLYAHVVCGDVLVEGERVREPSRKVSPDAAIDFASSETGGRYVSRGGEKLDHALERWKPPVAGLCFIDAGASTGGFTDCLLQHGAAAVHAVDVGYNQLDYRLRIDSRVMVHERTNIMEVARPDFRPQADAAVADLSFRSLAGAASHLLGLTVGGWAIALAKPQFEERGSVEDFHGVIEDDEVLERILNRLWGELEREGVRILALAASPIRGRKGNREFLLWLSDGRYVPDGERTAGDVAAGRHELIRRAIAEPKSENLEDSSGE